MSKEKILVLNFGGQTDQLIVRRVREMGVFAEIHECDIDINELDLTNLAGIILTGGPQSVNNEDSPKADKKIFDLGVPVLGICYGHQFINQVYGGEIETPKLAEYGKTELSVDNKSKLFEKIPEKSIIWMNHKDRVGKIAEGFKAIAKTANTEIAAMENIEKGLYSVQFHPEVVHSEYGREILENFVLNICGAERTWKMADFATEIIEEIRKKYAGEKNDLRPIRRSR